MQLACIWIIELAFDFTRDQLLNLRGHHLRVLCLDFFRLKLSASQPSAGLLDHIKVSADIVCLMSIHCKLACDLTRDGWSTQAWRFITCVPCVSLFSQPWIPCRLVSALTLAKWSLQVVCLFVCLFDCWFSYPFCVGVSVDTACLYFI